MMLPEIRRTRTAFMLTPLIDVIFLLLIFFMLSSQIAPYSLLPLGGVVSGEAEAVAQPPEATSKPLPLVVRVARGQVSVGGETIAISDMRRAAERFRGEGFDACLLIPTATATVQDIVSTLEALKAATVGSVSVLNLRRIRS